MFLLGHATFQRDWLRRARPQSVVGEGFLVQDAHSQSVQDGDEQLAHELPWLLHCQHATLQRDWPRRAQLVVVRRRRSSFVLHLPPHGQRVHDAPVDGIPAFLLASFGDV